MVRRPGPADRRLIDEVLVEVRCRLGPVELDGWLPPVQGAVGIVAGVTARPPGSSGPDRQLVLKIYRAPDARHRQSNEQWALGEMARISGIPAPFVHGAADNTSAYAWLVMTRRPGTRWADRWPAASETENHAVAGRLGAMLAVLHGRLGVGFGPLDEDRPGDALEAALARLTASLTLAPVPADDGLGRRITAFVLSRADALRTCAVPAFCHGDFNGGNVLVDEHAVITGVVDFERSRWGDPLSDLALTRVQVAHHFPQLLGDLDAAYWSGRLPTGAERDRLMVHELLQLFHEHEWVGVDRPAGWSTSRDRLRAGLEDRLATA